MKLQKIRQGFTLIELLVVITIIGILATGWVSVFTTQLQGARDSTRVNDMKLMETAIHQYFNDNSYYPPVEASWLEPWFTWSINQYVSKELKDPRDWQAICWADNDNTDGWDLSNSAVCWGFYVRTNDSFWLTDSAFKLGISFEKKVNTEKKAIQENDGWNNPTYFETFAWDGSDDLIIWEGGAATSTDEDMDTYNTSGWTNWSLRVY